MNLNEIHMILKGMSLQILSRIHLILKGMSLRDPYVFKRGETV